MAKLYNLAGMSTATTGTGTITLGPAMAGHLTFAQAGIVDGDTVTYAIKDGDASEIGRGVYTASGTTLTRGVTKSTNSDAAIDLSGTAEVFITASAEDFYPVVNAQTGTSYTLLGSDSSKLVTVANASAVAVTIPQATGVFAAGFYCYLANVGASVVTVTPTTSTIAGAASLVLYARQAITLISDGVNWQAIGHPRGLRGATTSAGDGYGGGSIAIGSYSYTGGTPGVVNSVSHASATVSSGVADYVWAGLDLLSNGATAGENVARYSQAIKTSTGPTWGMVAEVDDTTETANPSGAIYGLEVDASANGTDDSNTRRGAEVVLWRSNAAGADATFAYGWRLGPSATDNGHITVKKGFSFHGSSAFQIGIDLSETTYSTAALMLGASSVVSWNAGDVTLTHSSHNLTLANGMLAVKPNANATQANSATYQLKLQDTSGTAYLTAGYDGTRGVIQSWGGAVLSLNPQGNAVGIGTSAPGTKLQVTGGGTTIPALGSNGGSMLLNNIDQSYGLLCGVHSSGNGWLQVQRVDGNATAYNLLLNPNAGNVGIGTTSPSYKLEVSTDSAAKPSTNTWTISSDERLKQNIVPADLARCWEIVKGVPLKRYTWRADVYTPEQAQDRSKLGWIAQDVQPFFARAVVPHVFHRPPVDDGVENYTEQETVERVVERQSTEVEVRAGVPTMVTKTVSETVREPVVDMVPVVDEAGAAVLNDDGQPVMHAVPRMVTKTRPKTRVDTIDDCLSLNADQIYAAMYGALQLAMQRIEGLEARVQFVSGGATFAAGRKEKDRAALLITVAQTAVIQGAQAGDFRWFDAAADFAVDDVSGAPVPMDAIAAFAYCNALLKALV